jgi:uncharacterized protein YyaL (SSP411 family)
MPKTKENRLVNEKSPYLRQHAYNPVDWHPWGDEAFDKAKKENKPIFLSIGYSTCHWCHVMERESFSDESVARVLNDKFIAVKVDREERPDIDAVYMSVCQAITGGGGWPLTVILTPDKKPFFAGTYFPKESRGNRIGLIDLANQVYEFWINEREEVNASTQKIIDHLTHPKVDTKGGSLSETILTKAFEDFSKRFDAVNGGFGKVPKFPSPHTIIFLLRYYYRTKSSFALEMAEKTLDAMSRGGIFDHIGYGFHRYSTDENWFAPHFEKMLYDQAMMILAYANAHHLTKKNIYRETVEHTIEYVMREMISPEGGFFSAEDADSEGSEGKYYLWTYDEIKSILKDDAELFCAVYGIEDEGNFADPFATVETRTNIHALKKPLSAYAEKYQGSEFELKEQLNRCRQKLFASREQRIKPFKDTKILTDWNGLMIAALAYAGSILNDRKVIYTAMQAYLFLTTTLKDNNDKLSHSYFEGHVSAPAMLDDYAYLIWGAIELYQATFDAAYLSDALKYTELVVKQFKDHEYGGFLFSSAENEALIIPHKEIYDRAIPSGNSVMMNNLIRLSHICGRSNLDFEALQLVNAFTAQVLASPSSSAHFLNGMALHFLPPYEIALAGDRNSDKMKRFLRELTLVYYPHKIIILKAVGEDHTLLSELLPYTDGMISIDGEVTLYFCKNYSCELPMFSIEEILKALGEEA